MGVKNLWDILESCKRTIPLHHLQNKRVCIDLSCWIVQLQNVNKSQCAFKDKVYLKGLFHRIRALIALNCSLIFVTDGSIPAIKLSTYRRRLNMGNEVREHGINSQNVTSLKRNMGSEFSCMIKEAKILGMALGIPCLDGIEEGEAQCALLNSESLCDGCFTSDSDAFLFGARTVYRDICLGEGGYVVCYEMDDIERKLGFGRNSLITLGILLGGDYYQGVHGLGPESACEIVKSVGDSIVLQRIASEGLSFAKKSKGSKKKVQALSFNNKENILDCEINIHGVKHNSRSDTKFLEVIDAYLKPKCHAADSDAVIRVLALQPFQRTKFQQICTRFFEWPPEKTDEYILPKIAERDLRRFANLRSTSSELGLRLSVDKMAVKCPVSEIIKERKVQGQESYEVSWEDIDGLNTSIVPADLIDRACPEKVLEFEERQAQGKKLKKQPKSRRKKISENNNNTALNEIDLKLKELMLDIEQNSGTSLSTGAVLGNASYVNTSYMMNKDELIDTSSYMMNKDELLDTAVKSCNKSAAETEIIDLLSPSPLIMRVPRNNNNNSKSIQCVEVIDLCESETETSSPEHARKARELRLFIDGIRNVDV